GDVGQELEVEPAEQRLVPSMPRIDLQQRVAVRRRPHNRLGGDIACCTRPVLDHEGLTELLGQPLGEQARDDVGRRARREADDDAHRPRRIGLRPRYTRDRRERGSARGQMQEFATGKLHRASLQRSVLQTQTTSVAIDAGGPGRTPRATTCWRSRPTSPRSSLNIIGACAQIAAPLAADNAAPSSPHRLQVACRGLWNWDWRGNPTYSALMLAPVPTAAHFCVSAAMNAPKSSGDPTFGLALSLARIASASLVFIIVVISALSLLTIIVGVPAGARIPIQNGACSLGNPLSIVVGTLGSCGSRASSATASAFSFPASI